MFDTTNSTKTLGPLYFSCPGISSKKFLVTVLALNSILHVCSSNGKNLKLNVQWYSAENL